MEISLSNTYCFSIHTDLLEQIVEKTSSLEDFVRFGAACKSCHLATLSVRPRLAFKSLVPWMALDFESSKHSHTFHSLATGEHLRMELPPQKSRNIQFWCCWGSPFGWIFQDGLVINPISRTSIRLPKISETRHSPQEIVRAIMTASPDSPDCMIFINFYSRRGIYFCSRKWVYCRPRDSKWSPMRGKNLSDIVYFKGNLYACSCTGEVFLISGNTEESYSELSTTPFAAAPQEQSNGSKYRVYLVEIGEELCVVFRYSKHVTKDGRIYVPASGFEIHKLDIYSRKWKRVSSLGDKCIFVGANYSYSVRASSPHLRANCVYFSYDYSYFHGDAFYSRANDMGFYDLRNGEVTTFVELLETYQELCPPFWFTPTLS